MVVAPKRRNENNQQRNTANQPPFVVQHPCKKHPHGHPKANQQKNRPPLQRRFLLKIFKIEHAPFIKHQKQNGNAETVNDFAEPQKAPLPDNQERNPRQNTQKHIKHPLKAVEISVHYRQQHFSQSIVGSAARHPQNACNHIA